jgi:amino acid adenylation domain-containing protein
MAMAMPAPFHRAEVEGPIGERFRRVARAHPERPAVADRGRVTTYAELEAAAGAIGGNLVHALGEAPGAVALLCSTGAPLFSAMLGTLEAGRFYVPLDPRLPDARLAPIVRELDAAVIVADTASSSRARDLAAGSRAERVLVLALEDLAAGPAFEGRAAAAADLAYVLFTSGSTGRPKGVMQSHRNVLHNVWKLTEGLQIRCDDRITLLSSPSFGASVSDIYGALLNGACVCPFDLSGDGLRRLPEFLEREGITVLHAVPSAFRSLSSTLDGHEDLSKLRMVKLGGEAVLASDFDLYRNRLPRGCVFHVGFGATEINVIRQWFGSHDTPWPGGAPLGYAVDGTEVVLLDGNGSSRGRDETDEGEIGIVASTLAVGYWKDPELTAATFLPVEGRPDVRLYRTGDLGRLLPDGCLLHLGRKDARVKVRGHRVETAEVEAALLSIPGVREAAVERAMTGGAERLTAWVAVDQPGARSASALRRALTNRLPASMIPTRFVHLDALPRTASGKIDRRALPGPSGSRPPLEAPFREAAGEGEAAIAQAFALVLGLGSDQVGADDDFFDLGGDSLSAVDLLATLRARTGQELSVADLLAGPTPASLAERVGRAGGGPPGRLLCLREGSGRPVFVIPGGGGDGEDLFAARRIARLAAGDAPVFCLREGGVANPDTGAEELARLGIEEIRRILARGPYVLVGDCMGGILAFAIARRLRADGDRVGLLALLDTPFPFAGRRLRSWVRAHAPRADRLWGRANYFGERLRYHGRVVRSLPNAGARWRYLRRAAGAGARGFDPPPDARRREALARRASYLAALAAWTPGPFDGTVHVVECAESRRRGYGAAWAARSAGGVMATVPGAHADFLLGHGEKVGEALAGWLRGS